MAEAADTGADVTLVTAGGPVALTEPEQARIAKRVEVLMVTSRSLPGAWQAARAGSHLYVRFSKPLVATRGRVEISEVVIGLQDPSFIGPELSRHGRPHLLPGQAASCKVYDTIGEPRETE
jgi:hypothetical protein